MKKEHISEKLHSAYRKLLSQDLHLLQTDVNERSITHKLAEYLQNGFPGWNVDCEYNRSGFESKRLGSFKKSIESDDTNAVTVYPDIIIHHRGTDNNLVVIEAKKSSFAGADKDDEKLQAYKTDLQFEFAYKITFPIKNILQSDADADLSKYVQER